MMLTTETTGSSSPPPAGSAFIMEATGISKAFGHVQALRDVSFQLRPGEIHAIVGDNGAGKSTFIKVLSGVYSPDAGTLSVDGVEMTFSSPRDAIEASVATVHQDLGLVDARDVTANLFLGRELTVAGIFVRTAAMRAEASSLLARLKIVLPSVTVPVSMLSGGQRQGVAITRAIAQGGRVVIMDEPTAALGVQESGRVLDLIGNLRAEGLSVVLVSHNLEHVVTIADRVSVFHHGSIVDTTPIEATSRQEIVEMITFGRRVGASPDRSSGA